MLLSENHSVIVRMLGLRPYKEMLTAMQRFTDQRGPETVDEIWVVTHPSVFTLGQAGRPEHLLAPGDITVVQSDRGGQVTYHGPGQLVIYLLLDLRRLKLGVRSLVNIIETCIIEFLARYKITASSKPDAPGVYVNGDKIASLGLRVRKGCSYHGLSLNMDMDLEPFNRINVCGHEGLAVTQLLDHSEQRPDPAIAADQLTGILCSHLGLHAKIGELNE